MINDLLPIGSIVLLKGGTKKVMIFGVMQNDYDQDNEVEYDYIAVLYPEGNCGADFQYLFNADDIEEVLFRGYEDYERQEFLGKLEKVYNTMKSE